MLQCWICSKGPRCGLFLNANISRSTVHHWISIIFNEFFNSVNKDWRVTLPDQEQWCSGEGLWECAIYVEESSYLTQWSRAFQNQN